MQFYCRKKNEAISFFDDALADLKALPDTDNIGRELDFHDIGDIRSDLGTALRESGRPGEAIQNSIQAALEWLKGAILRRLGLRSNPST